MLDLEFLSSTRSPLESTPSIQRCMGTNTSSEWMECHFLICTRSQELKELLVKNQHITEEEIGTMIPITMSTKEITSQSLLRLQRKMTLIGKSLDRLLSQSLQTISMEVMEKDGTLSKRLDTMQCIRLKMMARNQFQKMTLKINQRISLKFRSNLSEEQLSLKSKIRMMIHLILEMSKLLNQVQQLRTHSSLTFQQSKSKIQMILFHLMKSQKSKKGACQK